MKVALGWQISSFFGWGVYGLNLALEWSKDPAIEASSTWPLESALIQVDPLRRRALRPFIARSVALHAPAPLPDGTILVDALGNEADGPARSQWRPQAAAIFFELPLSAAAVHRLGRYELIVAGSSWNAEQLRHAGLGNVVTILQGVDPTLFYPAPRRELFAGKFVIFSGGKAEPRKGQDLVVAAFRAFAQRHDDVVLVTAWDSPWPRLREGMDLNLSGLGDRVVDVGAVPNALMAPIVRECDVALFPNRCEGGTNLVAMECLACGIPIVVSANSGHLDLLKYRNVYPLQRQLPGSVPGWHDTDVGEILEDLEHLYLTRPRLSWNPIFDLTWSRTARDLKTALEKVYGGKCSGREAAGFGGDAAAAAAAG